MLICRIDDEIKGLKEKQKSEQSKLRQKWEEEVHKVHEKHKTDVQVLLRKQVGGRIALQVQRLDADRVNPRFFLLYLRFSTQLGPLSF